MLSKVLQKRFDKVCEDKNLYGDNQFGFRKGRSTTDSVFILTGAIRRALANKQDISVALIDISKE